MLKELNKLLNNQVVFENGLGSSFIWHTILIPLWKNFFDDKQENVYVPGIPPELPKGSVVFMGMNPSMNEGKQYKKELGEAAGPQYLEFAKWDKEKTLLNVGKLLALEKKIEEKHIYGSEMEELKAYFTSKIEKEYLPPFSHIDLLFIRGTDQKKVINTYLKSKDKKVIEFVRKQLEITLQLISDAEPKAIIVLNADVRKFLIRTKYRTISKDLPFKFQPNDEPAFYDFIEINKKSIPFIGLRSISGQAQLDSITKQSLKDGLVKRLKVILGQPIEEEIIRIQKEKINELELKLNSYIPK